MRDMYTAMDSAALRAPGSRGSIKRGAANGAALPPVRLVAGVGAGADPGDGHGGVRGSCFLRICALNVAARFEEVARMVTAL